MVGQALIANSRVKLTKEDVLRVAAPTDGPPGRIEQGYAPRVFTRAQARLLDRALVLAQETPDAAKGALLRLLAIRVALLAHPMSQVRAGTIHRLDTGAYESITESCLYHYVDGLRLTRPGKLWELARQINVGVFEGKATVHKANLLEKLPEIEADVAYFDPPYPGVMSYEKEYRVIDEILEGASRPTSPFTAKDGAAMLDGLFERALHIPVWLLSLGNAVVGIDELEGKMARFGRATRAIALKYQHLPAVATEEKKASNREFLVVGWDPDALEKLLGSVAGDHPAGVQLGDHPTALVEEDAHAVLPQLTPPESLPHDRLEKHHADHAEEVGALGRRIAGEGSPGMDDPDALGGKRRGAGDFVGRRVSSHGSK